MRISQTNLGSSELGISESIAELQVKISTLVILQGRCMSL